MSKNYITAVTLFLASTVFATGQDRIIKADLIRTINGIYGLTFEHKLNSLFSGQIGIETGRYEEESVFFDRDYELKGFSVLPALRIYPLKGLLGEQTGKAVTAPFGFFIGASLRYALMRERMLDPYSAQPRENRGQIYNYGVEAGYKYAISRLSIEATGYLGDGQVRGFDPMPNPFWAYYEFRNEQTSFYRVELSLGYSF